VWLDRIEAISGGSGSCPFTSLTQHLDNAIAQGKNAIQLVLYNMPNRDCFASASNGELVMAEDGVNRYKTEFIDPIVAILKNYPSLRIICILEPDTIPNLITNLSIAKCAEADSSGSYAVCLQYAINQIDSVGGNTYIYIDIAHSAWLGWSDNFQPFINKIRQIIGGTKNGVDSIDGFVDNIAKTLPWTEPFIPDGNASIGGAQIKSSTFYDWNPYTQEQTFVNDMRNGLISAGFPSTIGMLYDSGRSGWGGPNRPKAASTSTDVNIFVNASRLDRRSHRGNWCNQGLAGIGARPQVPNISGVDAFVWVKPPGESDGQAAAGFDPCDPNKTLDVMCCPGGINIYCNCGDNGAMAGAPVEGAWFQALFNNLVANAYPQL
jgi:cellulose 1,4-beta-cellobiosidase